MSSILICSIPTLGHVAPLLSVSRHLVAAGHRVRFLGGRDFETRIRESGADFLPLPPLADVSPDDPNAEFPERVGLTGLRVIRFDILHLFLAPVPHQFDALRAAIAAEPTDAVLIEPLFLGAAGLLSTPRASRPAVVGLGVVPLTTPDPDVAPTGFGLLPLRGPIGRARNALLQLIADRVVFAPVIREGRRLQREAGLVESTVGFGWLETADAVAQFTVSGFEYPRSRMRDTVRFVGPVTRSLAPTTPLPDWWDRLDDGRPVIHVTQGTVANKDFTDLIEPTIAGLANDDVHVVVSTGGRALSELPHPLPDNVLAAEFLPYDALLPRTSVLVTNGGYGGVHYALEHGVPLVVAGLTEDKIEVSARVAWSGAGINLKTNRPSSARVATAVRRVLAQGRYRTASQGLARQIAASPGLEGLDAILAEVI